MFDAPANFDEISRPEAAYCIVSASNRYNLPPESLLSIAMVEGGKIGTTSLNTNGTVDMGIMQVNSVWLKSASPLSAYVSVASLVHDVCTNVHAAAWILSNHVAKTGGDFWRAIGMYHHPSNSDAAQRYIQKINARLPLARDMLVNMPSYKQQIGEIYKINTVNGFKSE